MELRKRPLNELMKKSLDPKQLLEHFSLTDIDMQGTSCDLPAATVFFDLAGSSRSIRAKGAKAYALEYQTLFRDLTHIIYQNQGIVEKFPGDGISMHFVRKQSDVLSDPAINRAVDAVIEMDKYLREKGLLKRTEYRFSMAYGPDTIATKIGSKHHEELISIGHAVNVAHKLEKYIKDKGCFLGMDETCMSLYSIRQHKPFMLKTFSMEPGLWKNVAKQECWYGVTY